MPVRLSTVAGDAVRLDVARSLATGIHQVDSPVFDDRGRLYVTVSGARGQQAPVSIFRVDAGGAREPFASGIVNATSMAYRTRTACSTSPAGSKASCTRSRRQARPTPFVHRSRRGVRAGVRPRRHAVRRRSIGHAVPRRTGRTADGPGDAAAERCRVSPRGRPRRRRSTCRCRRSRRATASTASSTDGACRRAARRLRPAAGPRVRRRGLAPRRRSARRARAACTGCEGGRDPVLVASGEGLVGITFDPNGALVVASNDTVYGFVTRAAAPGDGPLRSPPPMTLTRLFRRKPIADLDHRRGVAAGAAGACSAPAISSCWPSAP